MIKNKKGFTLIELMIVISVIAILSAIALFAFNRVQKTARDARRRGDVKALQTAIVAYYADQGDYPATLGALCTGGVGCTGPATAVNYLGSVPVAPTGGTQTPLSYTAGYNSAGPTYSLCIGLEAPTLSTAPVWGVKGTSSTPQEYAAATCTTQN